ncbi:MAG: OmpH family outer membrane protein, partial [Calditrichaeota bacterium]|nr:OmpH family outer membrane protein [Calditrichota bacterium]
ILLSVFNWSASPRIAYVNNNDVISKYKGAQEAQAKFDSESKVWQSNVETLKGELDSLNNLWQVESSQWSKDKRTNFAKQAKLKEENLNRYSQAVQQKAAARQSELMNPIFADLNKYIAEYAENQGYDLVLGTTNGNIVYAAKYTEITKEVITYVNEQY